MKKLVWFSFLVSAVLFSSCATASLSKYHGIGRIKKYDIYSEQLPDSFDGFRIAFASDFHYESRFGKKRLPGLLKALQAADADLLYWEEIIGDGMVETCRSFLTCFIRFVYLMVLME